MPLLYTLVLWSFLIEIVLFTHVGPVPAASLDWPAMGILTGLALFSALAGLVAFARRDRRGVVLHRVVRGAACGLSR